MLKNILICLSLPMIFASSFAFAETEQPYGAVSSGHPLATQAGLDVLEKGGNAFDAAVAVSATLNVVEPVMSGLGGYGTTLIYDAQKKEIRYLNSSGKYPAKTNSDLMRAPTVNYLDNRKGAKSISTPSNLNAWKEMHEHYGRMPWNSLFKDAIHYAKKGFPIPPYTARLIASSFDEFSDYSKSFYGKNGKPLQEGDILIQKDLAKTYALIAKKGIDPFYRGEIALKIDQQMKAQGSFLSLEDLRADVADWWDPIKINYKGYDVYTMGTPGTGFSALFMLGVLEQFPLTTLQHNSQAYLHMLAETLKEAGKVRLTLGEPKDRDHIVNDILSPAHFKKIAQSIDTKKASDFKLHTGKEGMNTTHFVVVDRWGNMVSSTQTLGLGFGSKVMVEGTGIWMNNSMAFATFEPKGNPMDVLPGKYKLSSNSPTIIMKNDRPWAALGTPGGHTITQNVAQIVVNLIDFNMTMQEAIDAPKLAFFEDENFICTEKGIPSSTVTALQKMGHKIDNDNIANYIGLSGKIGNAMGVKILHNQDEIAFDVGVDRRKDGWSTTHKTAR